MTITPVAIGGSGAEAAYQVFINNKGQIVGNIGTAGDLALWQNGTISDIGSPPSLSLVSASGISDSGAVVGSGETLVSGQPDAEHGFLWQAGTFSALADNTVGGSGSALAINNAGLVVGFENTSPGNSGREASEWQDGVMTILPQLPKLAGGASSSTAYSVNNSGKIVGDSSNSDGQQHAVIWSNGTVTDLGALNNFGNQSSASGINNAGQVIGWSAIDNIILPNGGIALHAFSWSRSTGMADLGTLGGVYVDSYPFAINDLGQVVGVSSNLPLHFVATPPPTLQPGEIPIDARAVLWQNGKILDLNTLLPAGSGWVLQFATGINDAGQIVGFGTDNGAYTSFELTLPSSGPVVVNTASNQATLLAPTANSAVQGAGYDVLDLSKNPIASTSSAYTLSANVDGSFMLSTAGSSDHVSGVLQVVFADKTVTISTANSMSEYAALLYQGALGRSPDAGGLQSWAKIANELPASTQALGVYGLSDASGNYNGTLSVAGGFTNSAEFTAKYGSLTDAQFVTQLYSNILDRAPDSAGYNTWMTDLSSGKTREHVLVGFAESAEAISNATNGFTGQSGVHAAWLFLT